MQILVPEAQVGQDIPTAQRVQKEPVVPTHIGITKVLGVGVGEALPSLHMLLQEEQAEKVDVVLEDAQKMVAQEELETVQKQKAGHHNHLEQVWVVLEELPHMLMEATVS